METQMKTGALTYGPSLVDVIRAALMRKFRIEVKKFVRLKNLDGLLELPLDIIFTILEYLHPIDIYHLERSSPMFQNLLKDQIPFLIRIYRCHRVPLWPVELSYDQWSDLLFGDAICDRCRKFFALPDFVHRQRICSECFQSDFIFTNYPAAAVGMVPKGNRDRGWIITGPTSPLLPPYRSRDKVLVQKMERELEQMKSVRTSQPEIDEYVKEKVTQAQSIETYAYDCESWAYDLFHELSEDIENVRKASLTRLEQRFVRLGYQDRYWYFRNRGTAIMSSRWRDGYQKDNKRKSWKITVDIIKSSAREILDEQIYFKCTEMMPLAYTKYIVQPKPKWVSPSSSLTTNNPRPFWSYPPTELFLTSKPSKTMIYKSRKSSTQPQEKRCVSRIRKLFDDDTVKTWSRVKKEGLERCVTIPRRLTPFVNGVLGKMGLAISTFTCSMCRDYVHWKNPLAARQSGCSGEMGGRDHHHYSVGTESSFARSNNGMVDNFDNPTGMVLFGWEEVKNHLVCVERPVELKNRIKSCVDKGRQLTGSPGQSTSPVNSNSSGVEGIVFNRRASELMLIVLEKLGLDPAKTTAVDLDKSGRGFLCYDLPDVVQKRKGMSGVASTQVFKWRDFVIHVLRHGQRDQPSVSWSVERLLVKVVTTESRPSDA
ncbi:hypothetical protein BDN72DRAFT_899381 [Pluteus cervinus]|uniref:Uncharacterized protein n=1 Tax=Pluteus cervinus TaxID=181527 RepID=A0ACD3APY4_9AGAR|nr:hypothetical protein BDN72DRAFT_899381 [Pluteus cervinus]